MSGYESEEEIDVWLASVGSYDGNDDNHTPGIDRRGTSQTNVHNNSSNGPTIASGSGLPSTYSSWARLHNTYPPPAPLPATTTTSTASSTSNPNHLPIPLHRPPSLRGRRSGSNTRPGHSRTRSGASASSVGRIEAGGSRVGSRVGSRAGTPLRQVFEGTENEGVGADDQPEGRTGQAGEDVAVPNSYEEAGNDGGMMDEEEEDDEPLCRICFCGPSDNDPPSSASSSSSSSSDDEDDPHGGIGNATETGKRKGKGREKEKEDWEGRLISPCLCSGSMRHVHIGCLQRWRGTGRNKKAYMECTQCHFRYRLRRTRILGLASSRLLLLLTSLLLFFLLTLTVGSILHYLLHFQRFRRLVAGPPGGGDREVRLLGKGAILRNLRGDAGDGEGGEVRAEEAIRQDPLGVPIGIQLPGGLTYVSTGSGMFEFVIKSIRAFLNGDAEDVAITMLTLCRRGIDKLETYRRVRAVLTPIKAAIKWMAIFSMPFSKAYGWARPIMERMTLGVSLVGSMSFVSLLISSSLMAPFQVANHVRFGRGAGPFGLPMGAMGGGRRRVGDAARRADGLSAVGIGSLVLVVFVILGAVRAIKQLYTLTTYISVVLLTKAENAILEVNRKGEVVDKKSGAVTMVDGGVLGRRVVRVN